MANLNTFINIGANTGNFVGVVSGADFSTAGNVVAGYLFGNGSNISNISVSAERLV
jgi:hypothetical protein